MICFVSYWLVPKTWERLDITNPETRICNIDNSINNNNDNNHHMEKVTSYSEGSFISTHFLLCLSTCIMRFATPQLQITIELHQACDTRSQFTQPFHREL